MIEQKFILENPDIKPDYLHCNKSDYESSCSIIYIMFKYQIIIIQKIIGKYKIKNYNLKKFIKDLVKSKICEIKEQIVQKEYYLIIYTFIRNLIMMNGVILFLKNHLRQRNYTIGFLNELENS